MIRTVSTVLGDIKPVTRTYGDGSIDCPWCSSAIIAPKTTCDNPGCDAYPGWAPEALRTRREKQAAELAERERDAKTRASVAEASRERAAEHRAWETAQVAKIAEAGKRGACLRCLFQSGWERAKFIKHRAECPRKGR